MNTLLHTGSIPALPASRRRKTSRWTPSDLAAILTITALVIVSLVGLYIGDYFLCLEPLFLAFIPYIVWSAYRRVGFLDVFAPDVGFPLAYVLYLFLGSINVPIETQFGIVLPWIVWLYYIIGLAAYLVGVRLLRPPSTQLAEHGNPKWFWDRDRFITISSGLFAIGLATRTVVLVKNGIPFLHADDIYARVETTGGLLGVFSLCMEAACECFLLYLLIKRPKGITRYFMIAAITVVVLNGVSSTNRTALLRIIFAAIVIVHYGVKRFSFKAVVIFGILGATFASAMGTFRDVSDWGDVHVRTLERQGFTDETYWLANGYQAVRLPTETFYMTIQQIPSFSPFTYGATSLASLAEVLPGHRPGPSEIVKTTLRLRFVGFGAAATILAPLWFDGGVVGIILGMFLFGLVSRALHQRMLSSSNYMWTLIYGWYAQNAFKAIKDDILPELGFTFIMFLFVVVSIYSAESANSVQLGDLNLRSRLRQKTT